jgi:hypothetical protein
MLAMGAKPGEVARMFATFNAGAEAFAAEAKRHGG